MQEIAPSGAPASALPRANAALSLKVGAPRVVTTSQLFGHPLFKKNGDTQHEEASAAVGGPENTPTLSGSQWAKKASVEYNAAAGQYGVTTVGQDAKSAAPDDGSLVVHKAAEYTRARRTALDARIQQQGQEGPSAPQEGVDDQEQLTLGGAYVQCMWACVSSKCLCGSRIVARPSSSFFPRLCGPPSSPPWTLSSSTLQQRWLRCVFVEQISDCHLETCPTNSTLVGSKSRPRTWTKVLYTAAYLRQNAI